MKLSRLLLTVAAGVAAPMLVANGQQAAPDYNYPHLSRAMHQYYNQHPAEWQRLLESLPRVTHATPAARPAAPKVGSLVSKMLSAAPATGTFTPLTNPPPVPLGNPILLTDGTILAVNEHNCDGTWYRYTPDLSSGFNAYQNGTWTKMNPQPSSVQPNWAPRFFSSAVLPDGRVVAIGGEYNGSCSNGSDTSKGAIYDPVANTWTALTPPSNFSGAIGDAAAIVLPNGTYMQTDAISNPGKAALLNAATLAWTATGTGKYDRYDEESLTQLSDGRVLTVDAYAPVAPVACGMGSETYDYTTGNWTSAGNTATQQSDCSGVKTYEVGPLVMSPFGSAFSFPGLTTGTGNINVFDPVANSWSSASAMPSVSSTPYTMADAPAAVLPNGNMLVAMSPSNWPNNQAFPTPTNFWEYSPGLDSFTQIPSGPTAAANANSFQWNFLVLPSGQIMVFNIDINDVELYTAATRDYLSNWQPTVTSAPTCVSPGGTFSLSGTQLNGLTEGAYYGDDTQASTNFPLVLLVNSSPQGQYFAQTTGMTSRAIAPNAASSTSFTVPAMTEGPAALYVITNGIPSAGRSIEVKATCSKTASHDFDGDAKSDIAWRASDGTAAAWLMNGAQVKQSSGIAVVATNWSVVGQRDFDGDGKADWLWRDVNSGGVAIWFMNGTQVTQAVSVATVSNNWLVAGTGDFNGDGTGDVLWYDTNTGTVAAWYMNGAQVTGAVSFGAVPSNWFIVGSGDFNGDGTTDVLWRDINSGAVAIWFMSGTQVSSSVIVGNVPTNWGIVGTGDFDGDGNSDILWQDANSGTVAVWLMNGASVTTSASIAAVSSNWFIAETGDFNSDGKSDVLWRDSNAGGVAEWWMNGAQVLSAQGVATVPTAWRIQGFNAD